MDIPALGIRLNRHDADCDYGAIYMDGKQIAVRPTTLSDGDWKRLCRFICGKDPGSVRPPQPVALDAEAQQRLDHAQRRALRVRDHEALRDVLEADRRRAHVRSIAALSADRNAA